MRQTTKEVLEALKEVRTKVSDKIDTVIFFEDASWCYMESETRNVPSFDGCKVDVNILQDAIDSVDLNHESLPYIFQIQI